MSVAELERVAGLTLVAAELPGSPAIVERLRSEDEKAAKLLRASAAQTNVGEEARTELPSPPSIPVEKAASLHDRAALEARAVLLSELEKVHGIAA
jgi:hypothetical protein